MAFSLITILGFIVFFALVFLKIKRGTTRSRGKTFELGGYGITRSQTRSEKFFKPDPRFNSEQIANDPQGIFGETAMAALASRVCNADKRKYILMRNLYVPARSGYTEIDALLLHPSGMYVLESKNISGEISGSLETERWNQYLNEHTEHTFHNPIRQNIGHILALEHFLKIRHEQAHFISIVVFSDRCTLRKVPKDNEFWNIVHCSELQAALYKRIRGRKTIYTSQQLKDFYYKLQACTNVSEEIKAKHREYAHKRGAGPTS